MREMFCVKTWARQLRFCNLLLFTLVIDANKEWVMLLSNAFIFLSWRNFLKCPVLLKLSTFTDCMDASPRCFSAVRFRGCRHRRVKGEHPEAKRMLSLVYVEHSSDPLKRQLNMLIRELTWKGFKWLDYMFSQNICHWQGDNQPLSSNCSL